jgi:acyl-CoA thioesterase I
VNKGRCDDILQMKNILFFGDSLTAGYGLANAKKDSCPALIQQKINAEGLDYHVINGGLSGDTTSGGLMRIEYWMNRPLDVFVLELGVNDMIRRIPPAVTAQNLEAIILKVKQKYPGIKMAMMGMEIPPFVPGAPLKEFRLIFGRLAEKYQMALVPFYLEGVAGKKQLNLPDELHPSSEGYKIIAERIWPVIRALL